jgi:type IV secretory pathway VirB2 component (pilin)
MNKFLNNEKGTRFRIRDIGLILFILTTALFLALPAMASLESSLLGVKAKLTGFILPVLSVIGLLFAGFSFMTGSEKAKQHIMYAVIGVAIGFGAQAIVDFLSSTVR